MTIETTLKDKESGHGYPVQIEYELDHNDGNYPDDTDINISSVKVPVINDDDITVWRLIWSFNYKFRSYNEETEKEAIQAVRDWIEGNRIEAEEGRQP